MRAEDFASRGSNTITEKSNSQESRHTMYRNDLIKKSCCIIAIILYT